MEPCAPCRLIGATCRHPEERTSYTATRIQDEAIELPTLSGNESAMVVDDEEASRPLSSPLQLSISDNEPSPNADIDSPQMMVQDALSISFQEQAVMPPYDAMAGEDFSLPLTNEDALYPLLDDGGMSEFWQMPAVVCNTCPSRVSPVLNASRDRGTSSGPTRPISPGTSTLLNPSRQLQAKYHAPRCKS